METSKIKEYGVYFAQTLLEWYGNVPLCSEVEAILTLSQGIHLPDVPLVVVYQPPNTLSALMQRFGRSARNPRIQGYGVLLVEPKYFDDEIEKRQTAAEKRAQAAKAKKDAKLKKDPSSTTSPASSLGNKEASDEVAKGKKRLGSDEQPHLPTTPPKKRRVSQSLTSPEPSQLTPPAPSGSINDLQADWGEGSEWEDEPIEDGGTSQSSEGAVASLPAQGGDTSVADEPSPAIAESQPVQQRQRKERKLEDAVRLFLNCKSRNIGCRRTVTHRYFDNGRESKSKLKFDSHALHRLLSSHHIAFQNTYSAATTAAQGNLSCAATSATPIFSASSP